LIEIMGSRSQVWPTDAADGERETMMIHRLWSFFSRHIVTDVPDEISACMECDATQCRDDRFRTCPNRLAQAAALRALRAGDDQDSRVTP
jgi:hypothetical protein